MAELDDIKKILTGLVGMLQAREEMTRLGLAGEKIIQKRTREGKDVDGKPFQPYSEKYKKVRVAAGLPVHPVDLKFDDVDGMLTKIDHVIAQDFQSVSLDIMDPAKKKLASYHDSQGVAVKGKNIRHFWGWSEDERKSLAEILARDMEVFLADLTEENQ